MHVLDQFLHWNCRIVGQLLSANPSNCVGRLTFSKLVLDNCNTLSVVLCQDVVEESSLKLIAASQDDEDAYNSNMVISQWESYLSRAQKARNKSNRYFLVCCHEAKNCANYTKFKFWLHGCSINPFTLPTNSYRYATRTWCFCMGVGRKGDNENNPLALCGT